MATVFAIADLHFGHKKVAQARGFASTDEHDNFLVQAWNNVVTKRDVVYVLGDIFTIDRVSELRGFKKLALGNHDSLPIERYKAHFGKVRAYFDELGGAILSHIPIHPNQFPRYSLNIHGHLHDQKIEDPRYVCVSVEQCPGFAPIPLTPYLSTT